MRHRRNSLVKDKYNVGEGLFYLAAHREGTCPDVPDPTKQVRCIYSMQGAGLRPYWGHLSHPKALGRRWDRRVFDSHESMMQVLCGQHCGNTQDWQAARTALAKRFARAIYTNGLRAQYEALDCRGARVQLGAVKLLVYELAGRRGFTLWRGDEQVGFLADATSKQPDGRMGVWSCPCSLRDARNILAEAISHWPRPLVVDEKVGLGL